MIACSKADKVAGPPPIVADSTGVFTLRPTDFTALSMLDAMPDMLQCWRALEAGVEFEKLQAWVASLQQPH